MKKIIKNGEKMEPISDPVLDFYNNDPKFCNYLIMTPFRNFSSNCNKINDRNNLTDATGHEEIYAGQFEKEKLKREEEIEMKKLKRLKNERKRKERWENFTKIICFK